eukprot:scaffold227321_cov17-Prasinocladus_malaysianus.AAC.4
MAGRQATSGVSSKQSGDLMSSIAFLPDMKYAVNRVPKTIRLSILAISPRFLVPHYKDRLRSGVVI